MYLALILWKVPTTPRLKIDQKPSIVLVNRTNYIVAAFVLNGLVAIVLIEAVVNCVFIGREQANLAGHNFAHEGCRGARVVCQSGINRRPTEDRVPRSLYAYGTSQIVADFLSVRQHGAASAFYSIAVNRQTGLLKKSLLSA
jgi:hypothetical protein